MKNFSKKLITLCSNKNITLSISESCTGGMIASNLVAINGASKVLEIALVTYSNNSKIKLLNIPKNIIDNYGAVSNKTASYMVKGLFKLTNSDICVGITGIAGPNGGTTLKPVGLVYHSFFLKKNKKTIVVKKNYKGSRNIIRKNASLFTINQLYNFLNSVI